MENFEMWLENELEKRGWRPADLARTARITDSYLSKILNGTRTIGPDACLAVANALKISPVVAFRKAGLLPRVAEKEENEEELLYHYRNLTHNNKLLLLFLSRTLHTAQTSYQIDGQPGGGAFNQILDLMQGLTQPERLRLLETVEAVYQIDQTDNTTTQTTTTGAAPTTQTTGTPATTPQEQDVN